MPYLERKLKAFLHYFFRKIGHFDFAPVYREFPAVGLVIVLQPSSEQNYLLARPPFTVALVPSYQHVVFVATKLSCWYN